MEAGCLRISVCKKLSAINEYNGLLRGQTAGETKGLLPPPIRLLTDAASTYTHSLRGVQAGKGGDVEHIVGPFYSFSPGKGLANITNVGNTGDRLHKPPSSCTVAIVVHYVKQVCHLPFLPPQSDRYCLHGFWFLNACEQARKWL